MSSTNVSRAARCCCSVVSGQWSLDLLFLDARRRRRLPFPFATREKRSLQPPKTGSWHGTPKKDDAS